MVVCNARLAVYYIAVSISSCFVCFVVFVCKDRQVMAYCRRFLCSVERAAARPDSGGARRA